MSERVRCFARVLARAAHPKVRHSAGLPPELSNRGGPLETLPWPDVLLIEESEPGAVFLYRLTRRGESGGDTWHPSLDEAKHQAEFEYGEAVAAWTNVPDEVADAQEYAVVAVRFEP